jgi:hypothetical protein
VIREYVATLDEADVRELLLEAVERDMTLRDKLLFAARAANSNDLASMKTVVKLSFARVAQYVVRAPDLLEPRFGVVRVGRVAVRVPAHRQSAVRLHDIVGRRGARNAKGLIMRV